MKIDLPTNPFFESPDRLTDPMRKIARGHHIKKVDIESLSADIYRWLDSEYRVRNRKDKSASQCVRGFTHTIQAACEALRELQRDTFLQRILTFYEGENLLKQADKALNIMEELRTASEDVEARYTPPVRYPDGAKPSDILSGEVKALPVGKGQKSADGGGVQHLALVIASWAMDVLGENPEKSLKVALQIIEADGFLDWVSRHYGKRIEKTSLERYFRKFFRQT